MTAAPPAQRVVTPTLRRTARRWSFWVGAVVVAMLIALAGILVTGTAQDGQYLEADNPAPAGAMALVEVLRDQGVDVVVTGSLADTEDAVGDADDATLLLYDPALILDDAKLRQATELAGTVVLVDPSFTQLQTLAPGLAPTGDVEGTLRADCDVPAADRAGTIAAEGTAYRIIDEPDAVGCFAEQDPERYGLVALPGGLTVLGIPDALTNEFITREGNAALALNLLGAEDTLVWYLPTVEDLGDDAPPSLGDITPPWVLPSIGLLVLAAVAAAVWRGRRLGPLVVENLPVVVKSSETMQGRARLYARSS
ncbi:MAG TPA: DUF4350 domain-containing protein, partial [Rhodoglobus sp.]|nr:DUF4350 domain-containing protein [Rhodoglobus sp.]